MNWIDVAIIAILAWFTFAAFQAGFIREVVTVVAAIIGVVIAGLFYTDLADEVLLFIDNTTVARISAFGILFGITVLAGQMLALVLKPTVGLFQLGIFDQLAGAGFGFLKALIFVQVFLIVFVTYPKWGLQEDIDNSLFGSLIVERSAVLVNILPAEFEGGVEDFDALHQTVSRAP